MQNKDEILKLARKLVKKHGLGMKVLNVSLNEECRPVLFFSAPTRVDFRALVSDLNKKLNAKVDLRQVGARDEAKYIGGLGICGRKLCCSSWLPCIPSVPTKLIQQQNLQGSPGQYTGSCGKLLCCLAYEAGGFKLEGMRRDGEISLRQEEKPQPKDSAVEKAAAKAVKSEEKPKSKKKPPSRRIVRKLRLRRK